MKNIEKHGTSGVQPYPRTALVVDDEPVIRELLAMMLNLRGCKVWTAESGIQALALAEEHREDAFDLVITDVCMPGMTGVELVMRLREIQPAINVIFASGYAPDELVSKGVDLCGLPFIRKPFRAGAIDAAISALTARELAGCK